MEENLKWKLVYQNISSSGVETVEQDDTELPPPHMQGIHQALVGDFRHLRRGEEAPCDQVGR